MALKKVQPGDPLRVPAETFNTFIDVAQAWRDQRLSRGREARTWPDRAGDVLVVRNDSDVDQAQFAVLGVSGVLFTPADNEHEFRARPAFTAVLPTQKDHFVILIEPIRSGECGRAMISGVCPVKLEVVVSTHAYAEAQVGVSSALQSSANGVPASSGKTPAPGSAGPWSVWAASPCPARLAWRWPGLPATPATQAPFIYNGQSVAYDGSGDLAVGNFGAADAQDDLSWKLVNLPRSGRGGVGVAPVPTDSKWAYFALAGGNFGSRSATTGGRICDHVPGPGPHPPQGHRLKQRRPGRVPSGYLRSQLP
jgi:hypothetical protein